MADSEALTEVPPQLKKLVRLVIRAFYQPEHYVVMDILARYPCVTENDLLELLKFEPKKLRVILSLLKRDKLIKSIQKMESKILENGETKNYLANYHYINYKLFVNVVKYKLDRMREKIQAEERRAVNRTSYICPNCQNSYTDLEVDRLLDPIEGILRCLLCKMQLVEDAPEGDSVDARSLLSRLNDQLKPVLELLREVDNISLAPHILDPEPQSIEGIIQENKYNKTKQQHKETWATNKADDIYGDQTISINIGTESELKKKSVRKDAPQWMKESTVYQETASDDPTNKETVPMAAKVSALPGDEIMALLAHEERRKPSNDSSSSDGNSSSEEEEETNKARKLTWQDELSNQTINSSFSKVDSNDSFDSDDEDSSDDEMALKVGGKLYQLADIGPDIVAQMTPEEKERYTQLCQQAYSNYYQ